MQTFTGYEYLLIDIANHFGRDKLLFKERIDWVKKHITHLEQMSDHAKKKPLFIKAVMALRKAEHGQPTGHLVGFDAVCSGIQVMSAITGCVAGATATGLVDPDVRANAYAQVTEAMNHLLQSQGLSTDITPEQAKEALMTSFYGSKLKPIEIFGEDTPQLNAFYQAAYQVAPGPWELLQDLLASWQPYASQHAWQLPDGFEARVKVMTKKEARIEVDELDHATFTYEFYENEGQRKGLSNVANVVHSIDAYVMRSILRRCMYDHEQVSHARDTIAAEQALRAIGELAQSTEPGNHHFINYYQQQYERSGMPDTIILDYIQYGSDIRTLSDQHLEQLMEISSRMLSHAPFDVVTIHDDFKCHPNNMNHLRQHYIDIFAALAESNILSDILSQIHGKPGVFAKLSPDLGDKIRGSNYALS